MAGLWKFTAGSYLDRFELGDRQDLGDGNTFLCKKINVDNKVNFRYPDGYRFRLMQASICRAAAETKTHLANYA